MLPTFDWLPFTIYSIQTYLFLKLSLKVDHHLPGHFLGRRLFDVSILLLVIGGRHGSQVLCFGWGHNTQQNVPGALVIRHDALGDEIEMRLGEAELECTATTEANTGARPNTAFWQS